jgi:hypothetical protein
MALVGYRNLAWLKSRLLPADMGDQSDYDADLSNIGLAVAAHFDRYTGRELIRAVDARFECAGGVPSLVVSRYPIEEITSAVLISGGSQSDISDAILNTLEKAGVIDFGGTIGSVQDKLRIGITGGFWCDDDDEQPAGSTALPDDILGAWVHQCRAVCEAENIFRAKGAERPDKKTAGPVSLETLTLLPGVKSILQLHMRFA